MAAAREAFIQPPYDESSDQAAEEGCQTAEEKLKRLSGRNSEMASPISWCLCQRPRHEAIYFGYGLLIFTAWLFGAHPQYFVFLYMVIVFVSFPVKFSKDSTIGFAGFARNLNLCYIANILGLIYLVLLFLMPAFFVRCGPFVFKVAFGFANGPLLFANLFIWDNPLAFHDFETTVSSFAHLSPALLMYCLRNSENAITVTFQKKTVEEMAKSPFEVFLTIFGCYFIWVVLYLAWLFRGCRHEDCQRLEDRAILRKQLTELAAGLVFICFSTACFWSVIIHQLCLGIMLLRSIYLGAQRYIYILTEEPLREVKGMPEHYKTAEKEKSELIKKLQSQLDAYDRERAR